MNFLRKKISPFFRSSLLCKSNTSLLLWPWFVAQSGCTAHSYRSQIDTAQSVQSSIEPLRIPSAPPLYLEEDAPAPYDCMVPNNSHHNAMENSALLNGILSKKEAKEKAKDCLGQANKTIKKCFKYEQQIDQNSYDEQWWNEFSQGCFMKRWIGNKVSQSKRRAKGSKAALLKVALARADQYLNEMEKYIILAETLGSKKQSTKLRKKQTELKGQMSVIAPITSLSSGRQ